MYAIRSKAMIGAEHVRQRDASRNNPRINSSSRSIRSLRSCRFMGETLFTKSENGFYQTGLAGDRMVGCSTRRNLSRPVESRKFLTSREDGIGMNPQFSPA